MERNLRSLAVFFAPVAFLFLPVMLRQNLASLMLPDSGGKGEVVYTPRDSMSFVEKTALLATDKTVAGNALAIARSFLGAPYVSGTLDVIKEEKLVVNFQALDCWTYPEISIALALAQRKGGGFEQFTETLQELRYWGGTINGYGSRIHYFSGWVLQAEKLGYVEDITAQLGGVPYKKKVGYISARPAKFPKVSEPDNLAALRRAEARINAHQWHFIPKKDIRKLEGRIEEGDLILLTSVKADLDIAHQGFAIRQNGRIYLMHASSLGKHVLVSRQPLAEYMATQKGQSGIMVVRLK